MIWNALSSDERKEGGIRTNHLINFDYTSTNLIMKRFHQNQKYKERSSLAIGVQRTENYEINKLKVLKLLLAAKTWHS